MVINKDNVDMVQYVFLGFPPMRVSAFTVKFSERDIRTKERIIKGTIVARAQNVVFGIE